MTNYDLQKLIDGMIRKKISYRGQSLGQLIRWERKERTLKLVTDQCDKVILIEDLKDIADELQAEESAELPQQIIQTSADELQRIIMDNIRKVQNEKEYLPQAQEVNANVKTLLELAKTQIEYMKVMTVIKSQK